LRRAVAAPARVRGRRGLNHARSVRGGGRAPGGHGALAGAGLASDRDAARAALQDQGEPRPAQLRATFGCTAPRRRRELRPHDRGRVPVAMLRRRRVRLSRARARLRWARAHRRGGGWSPHGAAGRARLLLSPGRGRFQAAPESTLKLALAAIEKKKRVHEQVEAWTEALARFECPPEIAALRDELLYAPERAKPETRAFEQACARAGLSPARLFERCGLLADPHAYHINRFLHEFFPRGTGFPEHEVPQGPQDLPPAEAPAFSLDDVGTTEIDDAFSVRPLSGDAVRIGIHIAAP